MGIGRMCETCVERAITQATARAPALHPGDSCTLMVDACLFPPQADEIRRAIDPIIPSGAYAKVILSRPQLLGDVLASHPDIKDL